MNWIQLNTGLIFRSQQMFNSFYTTDIGWVVKTKKSRKSKYTNKSLNGEILVNNKWVPVSNFYYKGSDAVADWNTEPKKSVLSEVNIYDEA